MRRAFVVMAIAAALMIAGIATARGLVLRIVGNTGEPMWNALLAAGFVVAGIVVFLGWLLLESRRRGGADSWMPKDAPPPVDPAGQLRHPALAAEPELAHPGPHGTTAKDAAFADALDAPIAPQPPMPPDGFGDA